ncbi:hypothetical protein [Flavobacterium sp.]|uniref:hypothetical protein n=1 Tax=Flavobacterium sp. TaxID=239 RepID=UPI003A8F16A0
MKTLRILLVGLFLMTGALAKAQVSVSVNMNIGTPAPAPAVWVPATHVEARYYYMPEINVYYDINARNYLYVRNGAWVRTAYVPVAYRNYDFHRCQKVVVNNYYGRTPYTYYKPYKVKKVKHAKHYHKHSRRRVARY